MPRFVIERTVPGAGNLSGEELRQLANHSNDVLASLGPDIEWDHSYVAGDKIYCIYNAPNSDLIAEHARLGGFPADRITPVAAIIDPKTAEP